MYLAFFSSSISIQRTTFSIQALQDKVGAAGQRITEMETQLSNERERAVSAEEHGRSVERQLAEEQQNSDRTAKKREEAEAELAAQVTHDCRTPVKRQRPTIAECACLIQTATWIARWKVTATDSCSNTLKHDIYVPHTCVHVVQLLCQIHSGKSVA